MRIRAVVLLVAFAACRAVDEQADPGRDAPWAWDGRPMIDQVRDMLRAVDLDREIIRAWRSRPDEVAGAVVVLLKDPATDRNMREMGLGILEDLKRPSTAPAVLEVARADPDEGVRASAIRVLAALGADEARLRALLAAARSDGERIAVLDALGDLGRPSSLPLLEEAARTAADTTLRHVAGQAAEKVRVMNSPTRDAELVRMLRREGYPMRDWALARIVAGKNPALAGPLREVLDLQRKVPRDAVDGHFIYDLLSGMRALGQPLSPAEAAFVEGYGRGDGPSLPW